MEEEWRDIKGYEGYYQVSNLGRVRRLPFSYVGVRGQVFHHGLHVLKAFVKPNGYHTIMLSKDNVHKKFHVHRLVGETFIDNPQNKPQINHKDGNKSNNCVENLEWVTSSENIKHSYDYLGRKKTLKIPKFPTGEGNIHNKPILQYTMTWEILRRWISAAEISRETGIPFSKISLCARKNSKGIKASSHGFRWVFEKDAHIVNKFITNETNNI